MTRVPRDVTDAELSVLQSLWDDGPSTIRELTDRLYPEGGTSSYATVQKLLERLEAKRCVKRATRSRAHVFSASVDRDQIIGHELRKLSDKLCEGSLAPLLTHLARSTKLRADEIDELRDLVERLDREKKGGRS